MLLILTIDRRRFLRQNPFLIEQLLSDNIDQPQGLQQHGGLQEEAPPSTYNCFIAFLSRTCWYLWHSDENVDAVLSH